jgi:hypothetical protein
MAFKDLQDQIYALARKLDNIWIALSTAIQPNSDAVLNTLLTPGGLKTGGASTAVSGVGLDLSDSRLKGTHYTWGESVGSVNVAASGVTSITFPTGRFTTAPRVFAQITSGSAVVAVTWVTNISTTGFDLRVYNLSGTQIAATCCWYATQMTSTTSTG